jgi:hypothetical protein
MSYSPSVAERNNSNSACSVGGDGAFVAERGALYSVVMGGRAVGYPGHAEPENDMVE